MGKGWMKRRNEERKGNRKVERRGKEGRGQREKGKDES